MVSTSYKKKKNQRETINLVLACMLATAIGLLSAPFAQANQDTEAWNELREIQSLLRTDPVAALPRALDLRERTADETDQLLRGHVFLVECSAQYRAGDSDLATVACDNANTIADQVGDLSLLASARNARATVAYSTGRDTQAFIDYESAYKFAELSGDVKMLSPIQSNLAVIIRNTGAVSASLPYSQRALEAARALEDHSRIALVLLNLSDTYLELGQPQVAEDHVLQALEHADQGEIMRWRYAARLQQAYLILEQDRAEEALAALNALATNEALRAGPRQIARLRILFAGAYRDTGNMAGALAAAEESVAIAEGIGDRWRAAKWRIELALLLRLEDRLAEALATIASVEEFARTGSYDRLLRSALAEKAEILQASEEPAMAYFALRESREIESRMESDEAEAQLWVLNVSEQSRQARQTIMDLEERSVLAERRAEFNVRMRNGLLWAIALIFSAGIYWRQRSVRMALSKEVEQSNDALRVETSERTRHQEARLIAEQKVRQQQELEAIGRLTGGIAHDFNNLLTAVNGSLELLKTSVGDRLDDQHLQLIEEALTAGTAGAEITGQLLAFARQMPLQPERFDCVQHIHDVSGLLRRAAGEEISLSTQVEHESIPVTLDRGQLTTALLNLVVNAREAENDAGEIVIEIEKEQITADGRQGVPELAAGEYVSISVRDNGCGMTEEEIGQAFQPFYSTKDFSAGAGLGLSMVYGFARQSNGTAIVDSSPGVGTIVTLLLPVASEMADPETTATDKKDSSYSGKALVVEDQDQVRTVACAFLESLGFDVVWAENADMAVRMIDAGLEPSLMLVDIVMPGSMNGREFAAWAHKELPEAAILLTTGYADADNHADCPFPIVQKPYRREDLRARLAALSWPDEDRLV